VKRLAGPKRLDKETRSSFNLTVASCGNNAQHKGVENDKHNPVIITMIGAPNPGVARNSAVFSKFAMISGGNNIPGVAIKMREGTT